MNFQNEEVIGFISENSGLILLEVELNFTVTNFNKFSTTVLNISTEANLKINLLYNVFAKPVDFVFVSSLYEPLLTGQKDEVAFTAQMQGIQDAVVWVEWKVKGLKNSDGTIFLLFHVGRIVSQNEVNENKVKVLEKELTAKNKALTVITKRAEILNRIIQQYTPKAIWERTTFFAETGELEIPNEVLDLTFLFIDIKDFTTFSERHSPEQVILALHDIFSVAMEIIDKYSGDVDKFIGDAIFAVFEIPLNACQAAMEIQKAIGEINESRINLKEEPLHLRAGINSGKAIRGNVGSTKRKDNTIIGDPVNLASRLEKICQPDKVLISDNTYKFVEGKVKAVSEAKVHVRGRKSDLMVYYIVGLD